MSWWEPVLAALLIPGFLGFVVGLVWLCMWLESGGLHRWRLRRRRGLRRQDAWFRSDYHIRPRDNVVDLDAYRPGWGVADVECQACGHVWLGVVFEPTVDEHPPQCPRCRACRGKVIHWHPADGDSDCDDDGGAA